MRTTTYVIVPNWNGKDRLKACLDSLAAQTFAHQAIVVENGSSDGSVEFVKANYPEVILIEHTKNQGFAGGVNAGIRYALGREGEYMALFNNDAVADKHWLSELVKEMEAQPKAGIVTSKLLDSDGKTFDSTGDFYTTWGLPFPRGRGEPIDDRYDKPEWVFGASGGASLYRSRLFKDIGLFDEDFFAYYEDIDLSFRAQLAGWQVRYTPKAVAYHQIGATSGKIKGFTTYHSLKNLQLIFWKDVPVSLMFKVLPRLLLANGLFFLRSLSRGQVWPAAKGVLYGLMLTPKKLVQRLAIQHHRKVPVSYIKSIMVNDLPPNAAKLRKVFRRQA